MSDFILSCCSTADLTKERFDSLNIRYICFHYTLDGVDYPDDLGESMPFDEFYRRMEEGAMTATSQVNRDEYLDYFEELLQAGKDILHVTLSSGLSGAYNSACGAAKLLQKKYPDQKIYVVDSLGASSGYGLIMATLAAMRDKGMSIDEVRDWIEKNKLRMHHWFFSTDLKYYVRGGRISKTAGRVGTILHICPLLNMDNLGRLVPRRKIRTKHRVIREIAKCMDEHAENGHDYSGKCFICNSACREDAEEVASIVEENFPKLDGKVEIYSVGTVIGSHTGPGTVALFFWGDERID